MEQSVISIDVLIERKDMAMRGFFKVGNFGNDTIYQKDGEPNFRYLGHYVDDFCKYVRLTNKLNYG
jgi:hypothetical protein